MYNLRCTCQACGTNKPCRGASEQTACRFALHVELEIIESSLVDISCIITADYVWMLMLLHAARNMQHCEPYYATANLA